MRLSHLSFAVWSVPFVLCVHIDQDPLNPFREAAKYNVRHPDELAQLEFALEHAMWLKRQGFSRASIMPVVQELISSRDRKADTPFQEVVEHTLQSLARNGARLHP